MDSLPVPYFRHAPHPTPTHPHAALSAFFSILAKATENAACTNPETLEYERSNTLCRTAGAYKL